MKIKHTASFLIALMVASVLVCGNFSFETHAQNSPPDVYFGVDIAYGGAAETKQLIDQISPFCNLLVIGQSRLMAQPDDLTDVCQYAYDRGIYFITFGLPAYFPSNSTRNTPIWMQNAEKLWPNHYLGIYRSDEPGGNQVDGGYDWVNNNIARYNSSDPKLGEAHGSYNHSTGQLAATRYISTLEEGLLEEKRNYGKPEFTSDYALYWFDYESGYDTIFSEFVWNENRQLTVALSRGAATVQNKTAGVIIGWRSLEDLGTRTELYTDLITAYDSGAKYITIFDSNQGYTAGILRSEHLLAMQQFWWYAQTHPRNTPPVSSRVAAVLPAGYGCALRRPDDSIWGLWPADAYTYTLYYNLGKLVEQYGNSLDVIYDDNLNGTYGYNQLINWTDPLLSTPRTPPSPTPAPTPTPSATPSPTPARTSTPTPTPTPSPTLTPNTPIHNPTNPLPTFSPTQQPTQTPENKNAPPPSRSIYVAITVVIVAVTNAGVLFVKKRMKNQI